MGQQIGEGFAPDIHCANGAPRESFIKITRAEAGGVDGESQWRPVTLGIRPMQEDEAMQTYLAGGFITVERS